MQSAWIADSMTRDVGTLPSTDVFCFRGFTVQSLLSTVKSFPSMVQGYRVIVIHIGTNNFGSKSEWFRWLEYKKGKISGQVLDQVLASSAVVNQDRQVFGECYLELVQFVRSLNPEAWILLSSILPRLWDHDRRDEARRSFNVVPQSFTRFPGVVYVKSFHVFFNGKELKKHYFMDDGLHLSPDGTNAFRSYICAKINRALLGHLH